SHFPFVIGRFKDKLRLFGKPPEHFPIGVRIGVKFAYPIVTVAACPSLRLAVLHIVGEQALSDVPPDSLVKSLEPDRMLAQAISKEIISELPDNVKVIRLARRGKVIH